MLEKGTGITALTLNSDGSVASRKTLLSYKYLNHGLALSVDGKTLFARQVARPCDGTFAKTRAKFLEYGLEVGLQRYECCNR